MELLKYRQYAFLRLLTYRFMMVMAYQIIAVVVGWHLYELTHDTLSLGLVGLAEALPYFSSALFAGYWVDHYSRKWFGVLSAVMMTCNAFTLMWIALGQIPGNAVYWIYGSIMFTGLARAFIAPSYTALFALIFEREQFARASGLGSSIFQFGLVSGPALGGLIVAYADKATAYGVAAACCACACLALSSLRLPQPPFPSKEAIFKSIGEGLRFVTSNQVLFGAQMLDMFAVLFGGAVAMLPVFVKDIYGNGAEALGILRAAPAIGAVITGIYIARYPINRHAGLSLMIAVAGFGVCMILFACTRTFWLAALILFISGLLDGLSVVLRGTILQLATPDHMRGRVAAINGIFIGSSNELGAFESGLTARWMGLVPSVIFGGLMTLSVVGITAKLAPKLRRLHLEHLH